MENSLPKRRTQRKIIWSNLKVFVSTVGKGHMVCKHKKSIYGRNKLLDKGILSLMILIHLSDLRKKLLVFAYTERAVVASLNS